MPEETLQNLGLKSGWIDGESGWGPGMRGNLAMLDNLTQLSVLSIRSTAPGGPSEGARYIVAVGASGTWSGHDKEIAVYQNGGWNYYTPKAGWRVFNVAYGKFYFFNGLVWSLEDAAEANSLPFLSNVTRRSSRVVAPNWDKIINFISEDGQSLSVGTLAGGVWGDGSALDEDNVFTFEYDDDPDGGPIQFSRTITGIVPLKESYGVTIPNITDHVTGITESGGTTSGETLCTGIIEAIQEAHEQYHGTNNKPKFLIGGGGRGGKRLNELMYGSEWWEYNRRKQIEYARDWCIANGYILRVIGSVFVQGTDNTITDEDGLFTLNPTPQEFRDGLLARQRHMNEMYASILGPMAEVPMFVTQISSITPSGTPVEGRVPNVGQGVIMASEINPLIFVCAADTNYPTQDGLHLIAGGYRALARQIGWAIFQFNWFHKFPAKVQPTKIIRLNNTQLKVIYDRGQGPIRLGEYEGRDIVLSAAGTGYAPGMIVYLVGASPGDQPMRLRVLTVDGSGGIETWEVIDPGSFKLRETGTFNLVREITGYAVTDGGTDHTRSLFLDLQGGTAIKAAQGQISAVSGGAVTALDQTASPVVYTLLPTNPVTFTGGTGTDVTANILPLTGTGATCTVKYLGQSVHTDAIPSYTTAAGTIVSSDTGFSQGATLTAVGYTLPTGGKAPTLTVQVVDGDGRVTFCRHISGGVWEYPAPVGNITYTDGVRNLVVVPSHGGFPVSDPAHCGYELLDSNGLVTILNVSVADAESRDSCAVLIEHNPSTGVWMQLRYACKPYSYGGPSNGARGTVRQTPLLNKAGPFGIFCTGPALQWVAELPITPALFENSEPLFVDGDGLYFPGGNTTVAIPAGGAYVGSVFATRSVIATGLDVVQEPSGGRYLWRHEGDADTTNLVCSFVLRGARVRKLRGKTVALGWSMGKGADYSGGNVTVSIVTNATDAALSGGNALPVGNTSLTAKAYALADEKYNDYSFSSTAVVPSDAEMIVVRFLRSATGTAGANDWLRIGKVRLDEGSAPRGYVYQSVDTIKGRLSFGVNDNLLSFAGLTGAADKLAYFTGAGALALADMPAQGRTLLAAASQAAQRTVLGLVPGTDVQAQNAKLSALAALSWVADTSIRFTGSGSLITRPDVEGLWTPTFNLSTPGDLSVSYGTATATYQRIGDRAHVSFTMTCTPTYTTGSGTVRIGGLPFLAANSYSGGLITELNQATAWPSSATGLHFKTTAAQAYLYMTGIKPAGVVAAISATQVPSGVAITISGTLSYNI